jgi:hypothetical protein
MFSLHLCLGKKTLPTIPLVTTHAINQKKQNHKHSFFMILYTFAFLNRRLYNPEIAFGDFSDIKGDLSFAK